MPSPRYPWPSAEAGGVNYGNHGPLPRQGQDQKLVHTDRAHALATQLDSAARPERYLPVDGQRMLGAR